MLPGLGVGVGLCVAFGVVRVHATRNSVTSTMTFATRPVTYRSLTTRLGRKALETLPQIDVLCLQAAPVRTALRK